jgi:hypothetical protein
MKARIICNLRLDTRRFLLQSHDYAEVNLAWWLAWTSNPVGIHWKVGSVGSIPMHLRQVISMSYGFSLIGFDLL